MIGNDYYLQNNELEYQNFKMDILDRLKISMDNRSETQFQKTFFGAIMNKPKGMTAGIQTGQTIAYFKGEQLRFKINLDISKADTQGNCPLQRRFVLEKIIEDQNLGLRRFSIDQTLRSSYYAYYQDSQLFYKHFQLLKKQQKSYPNSKPEDPFYLLLDLLYDSILGPVGLRNQAFAF